MDTARFQNSDYTQKKIWVLRSSIGYEGSFVFQTIVLPGSSSSLGSHALSLWTKENEAEFQYESEVEKIVLSEKKVKTGSKTVISALVSISELSVLHTLASSITSSPPPIKDHAYVIRRTATKGLGMFAQRDIEKGELIAWERPAIIAPGLEWEGGEAKTTEREEVYGLLADGFVDLESIGGEMKDEGRRRLEEIRGMAISSCFGGDQWVEGVIGANALVLELGNGNKERKAIYGGVYPLINRCNHSCCPNVAVHFTPSILTLALYALRSIKAGEEITKSYVNTLLPTEKRKEILRKNYGFDCDCRACTLPRPNSDENRIKLLTLLTTPTFRRWSSDLTRSDDFLVQSHLIALEMIEAEEVYAVESIFLEELALGCALMGDEQGFKHWARKIVSGGRWIGQMAMDSGKRAGKETSVMDRGKWVWWLENPEKRVRKWGWRKRLKEEMKRQKGLELEAGMLEGVFGSTGD